MVCVVCSSCGSSSDDAGSSTVILAYPLLAAARECEADMIVIGTH